MRLIVTMKNEKRKKSKAVAEIDQQLYRKYDLTADEIEFIETHVKEMA